jgi:acyl-CoA synthetase (AMP-forming)/AMP-acid ligase II
MAAVEAHFGVPLVEAYGMTEASHQVAVNPLPPGARRPGSVGRPAGVEVAVVDGNGAALPTGGRGEVVIRGPTVTAGYEGVAPSEFLYPGGWLRTGDEGHIDADGYLVLSGRIKELINRGGEKVSPREVEEVLLTHPSVAEALVFAVPHARLGEEVGAAVVPAPGAAAPSASDLRALVSSQLAPFKVPRTIRVIDSIPLGPTGKPQRVGMAERLGFA